MVISLMCSNVRGPVNRAADARAVTSIVPTMLAFRARRSSAGMGSNIRGWSCPDLVDLVLIQERPHDLESGDVPGAGARDVPVPGLLSAGTKSLVLSDRQQSLCRAAGESDHRP
jgi:hypothetical protein